MEKKDITLKVAEATQDDVGKGTVRIDSNFLKQIGVKLGEIVELKGNRTTVAIAERGHPGDIGLNVIRMDGLIRRNAQTGVGEMVKVKKANVQAAKKVVIAPARKDIIIRTSSPAIFKNGLMGRAVIKGDILSLGGTKRRMTTLSSSPVFEDFFRHDSDFMNFGFGNLFGLGDLKFVVASTQPKDAVIITAETEVEFNPEAVDITEEKGLPEVSYEDVGGLEDEIKKIREMVELPLKHPEIFERLGVEPPKGVLLHGPPGTGKTLLAKAVANETNSHFITINGPEIMSKFYGQSEENLRKKFEDAEKNAPAIIFIDEIDAIAIRREETHGEVERRVVAQLLGLMDGLKSRGKVVVIAATNVPSILDPALRRPGRFDREIEIGVPRVSGRLNILKIHTRNMPIKGSWHPDIAAKELIKKSDTIEENLSEGLSKNNNKIKDIKEELLNLQSELKELEKRKIGRDESLLGTVLNKISLIANQIKNKRLEEEEFKEHISHLKLRIEDIKKVKEFIKDKKNLDGLIKKVEEIENFKEIWGTSIDMARRHFLDITKNKLDNELRKNLDLLIGLNVLEPAFYDAVHLKGVAKDLENISNITHGFVGADLASLAKEAAMVVLRRLLPDLKYDEEEAIPNDVLEKLRITMNDFKEALKFVRPSAMREVLVEVPNVKWETIGGLDEVKQELKEAVEWPLKHPDAFKRLGVSPPKGILLYGPPGTGKTMLAKAVANESEANFILVNGPSLLSKWVGESEKAVRKIFEKARQTAPTIIFFDEIDSLAPRRGLSSDSHVTERVVNQLLSEIDGLEALHDVVIVGATNRPDIIDPALLRPGRFDRIILVPPPDQKAREQIFKVHTKYMPLTKDVDIRELAAKTEGYVGADIESICREAAIMVLRKDIKAIEVGLDHFNTAREKVRPSATKEIEKAYRELEENFTKARAKQMLEDKPSYLG